MAKRVDLVNEFYGAAGLDPSLELRLTLVREELAEVREAMAHLLKEFADLQYVMVGLTRGEVTADDMTPEVEEAAMFIVALTDVFGQDISDEAFKRVHQSNMSKLTDGVLVRDPETGKVLKGPNYLAPDLSDLI